MAVDVETYSSVDIDSGVYTYAESEDFEILLVAYKLGDEVKSFMPKRAGKPDFIGLTGGEDEFLAALTDPGVIKTAYNANFERVTLSKFYGVPCPPDEWRCTAVLASVAGLPRSLDGAGVALGLPEDKLKLRAGKTLISYFCKPCKPTKSNGGRTRNYPHHDPDKWRLFTEYNLQDVVTEQAIRDKLRTYTPGEKEQRLWSLDQEISDRGIRIDRPFVEGIIEYDTKRREGLKAEAAAITGLQNANSVAQLKEWLTKHGAEELGRSLSKDAVSGYIERCKDPEIKRVLEIRQALGKTSTKKYAAMLGSACHDDRVRGMLQFYGANRTGRWTGKIVQPQNLPQNHIPDLDLARGIVAERDFDELKMLYGEPAPVFSELVRTAFIPSESRRFVVSDFSAIEARVIAWLAGEEWRLRVFEEGGDIYCASASRMFGVPVEKHGVNAHLRQQGKVAELALGYGGGVAAIESMDKGGAIPPEKIPEIISSWRMASNRIVKLWGMFDKAAQRSIAGRKVIRTIHGVTFCFNRSDGAMLIKLPSGRSIAYQGARIGQAKYGDEVMYYGVNQTTHKWDLLKTYGGKLVENVVQAIARDCLAEKLLRVAECGYDVVAHVHDEMIVDVPRSDTEAAKVIDSIMAEPIPWADGLPLKGSTYECDYYMKD